MNDKHFLELKRLIMESEQRLRADMGKVETRLERKIDSKVDSLRSEMMDGFAGVAEAIETIYTYVDNRFIAKPRWLRSKT
jgi:hypothetical protein